jgi:hypothetical protein
MKKVFALLLSFAVLLALGAAPALAQGGTFAGSGDSKIGGAGSVAVEVTLDDSGVITDVKVTANNDTPASATRRWRRFPPRSWKPRAWRWTPSAARP